MASLRSSVILAVICLVSGAASAAIQNETRLSEVEEQKSNCRKTDPGYKTSTDDIDKFNENYVIASIVGGTHKDEETLCSMKITWKTAVRFFKWTEVYDGQAEVSPGNPNIDPGYTVVVRHFDSYEQAKEKAIDGLVDHLTKLGLINEQPCYVGPYPDSLVNIDPTGKQCPPNSNVSACTECTFHCTNEADVDFDKTTTVRCCGNGHFDREIMPCDGRPRTLTSPRPQTTTSSVEPQSNCRTSSGYYTDGGSIGGFNENCIVANLIPGGKHTSEESLCGVEITWRTCARIDKIPSDVVVYDGQAEISDTNADTPYTVIVRGKETYAEARKNAIDALVDHLTSIGYIKEKPCYVGHYPNSLVNIGDKHNKCPPNSHVSACTECTFQCTTNEADADFDKTTTIRCCGNGHFDDEMPSCKAGLKKDTGQALSDQAGKKVEKKKARAVRRVQ